MNIHYLQHIEFENLGCIEAWAKKKNHTISVTYLYNNDSFPSINSFDLLVVMGGPMNIYEEEKYPWLAAEKLFINNAIESNKLVLGICLGAQLIADVLGGKTNQNSHKEIGWFPVRKTTTANQSTISHNLPNEFTAFHWHSDKFELPKHAVHLFESDACVNQGFIFNEKIIGLQFHLEMTQQNIDSIITHCNDELIDGKYVQTANNMINQNTYIGITQKIMYTILDNLCKIST